MYQVIEAAPERVRDQAAAALRATRGLVVPVHRYDWLYCQNPDGPAVVWTLSDNRSGKFSGFAVGLPRRVLVAGHIRRCWVASDFSIYHDYRTLDVALELRRAAQRGIDAGRADLFYAHPNPRLQFIHERAENHRLGPMVRVAKILHSRPILDRRIKRDWLAAPLAAATDPLLKFVSREGRWPAAAGTRLLSPARFDDRFDDLFEQASAHHPIIGVRDRRYLEWRYAMNPLYRTHAVLIEEAGRLHGYALFKIEGRIAHVLDLLTLPEQEIAAALLAGLIWHARRMDLDGISAIVLQGSPWLRLLRAVGFIHRPDKSDMFVYASPGAAWRGQVFDHQKWYATAGDRDV